jgi:hypothetical protein
MYAPSVTQGSELTGLDSMETFTKPQRSALELDTLISNLVSDE